MRPQSTYQSDLNHLIGHMVGCMNCPVGALDALLPDMIPKDSGQKAALRHTAGHLSRDCLRCEDVLRRFPPLAEYAPKPTEESDLEHVAAHMAGCLECDEIQGRLPPDLYARTAAEEADLRHVITHLTGCHYFGDILDRHRHLAMYIPISTPQPASLAHPQDPAAMGSSEDPDLAHIVTHMRGCAQCADLMSPEGLARGDDKDSLRHVMTHMQGCPECAVLMVKNEAFAVLNSGAVPVQQTEVPSASMTIVDSTNERGRGRPAKEKTTNGMTMLRFEVPTDTAEAIRSMARATGQDIMPFLARTICQALRLPVPIPQKRGPKLRGTPNL